MEGGVEVDGDGGSGERAAQCGERVAVAISGEGGGSERAAVAARTVVAMTVAARAECWVLGAGGWDGGLGAVHSNLHYCNESNLEVL